MNDIIHKAANIYSTRLRHLANPTYRTKNYILSRGITQKTIDKFHIGYCNNNEGYKTLSKDYTDEQLLESGIFYEKNGHMV